LAEVGEFAVVGFDGDFTDLGGTLAGLGSLGLAAA
jgi:hypothetical protein